MARAERSKRFKGVQAFTYGGWAAVSRIDGIDAILYVSDSEEECASAYNEYIKLTRAKHWERNQNPVEHCHNMDSLWAAVLMIGSTGAKRIANGILNKIRTIAKGGTK